MDREPMRCPNDGSRLVEVERADVMIDACPECRGVWLDRGELDKILVREREMLAGGKADEDFFAEVQGGRGGPAAPPPGPPPRADYDPRYDDPGHRRKKRKRSMLEDLFDFD